MGTEISPTRRLFSNAIISVGNVVVSAALLFVLYRYLLNQLGAELVGLWSLVVASVGTARLADLGMAAGLTKFVASHLGKGDERGAAHVVETAVISLLFAGTFLVLCLYPVVIRIIPLFVPAPQVDNALTIAPYVLSAFCIGLVANAALSALDGCQRIDLRVCIMLAGQLGLLAGVVILVPRSGLSGVAAAQAFQSCLTLIAAWCILRRQLPHLPLVPHRWNRHVFRSILPYSAAFQLNNLLLIVVDPVVKVLLTRYGGLSATAYFDMANQLVQRLRLVLVNATQVLVPATAHAQAIGRDHVRQLYATTYRIVFAITVPFFCLTAALIPVISTVWIGREEHVFEVIAWIALMGLALNTIGAPSYFSNVGTGNLQTNTLGLALVTILTCMLGWLGGRYLGIFGVSGGYFAAMMLGAAYIQYQFHRINGLSFSSAVPPESLQILSTSLLALAICRTLDIVALPHIRFLTNVSLPSQFAKGVLITVVFAACTWKSVWSHPVRRSLSVKIAGSFQ